MLVIFVWKVVKGYIRKGQSRSPPPHSPTLYRLRIPAEFRWYPDKEASLFPEEMRTFSVIKNHILDSVEIRCSSKRLVA